MWAITPDELTAIKLSLKVASVAMVFSLPLAVGVAFALSRGRFLGKTLLDGLIHLPLVLPPVVTGYALLLLFGKKGPIGSFLAETFGLVFSFRWTGAALAAAVMGFPLMVRAIRLAMDSIEPGVEAAASTLGASPMWVFLTVTLPMSAQGIIAGAMLSFAKALGEFGATITFVSNIPGETQTIPAAIYSLTQTPGGDDGALRLSLFSVALSLVALVVSETLARRAGSRGVRLQ